MKRCKVCRKKPRLERRVNCEGIIFCSDHCYEEYDNSPNDFDHPYSDDYESMHRIYKDWMTHYEEDLHKNYWSSGSLKKEELIELVNEDISNFDSYYALASSDGISPQRNLRLFVINGEVTEDNF